MQNDEIDRVLLGAEQQLANVLAPQRRSLEAQSDPRGGQLDQVIEQKVAQAIGARVSQLPMLQGAPGRDGLGGDDIRALIQTEVAKIPPPKDGRDGKDGIDGRDGGIIRDRVIKMPDYERLKESDGSAQVAFIQSGIGANAMNKWSEPR